MCARTNAERHRAPAQLALQRASWTASSCRSIRVSRARLNLASASRSASLIVVFEARGAERIPRRSRASSRSAAATSAKATVSLSVKSVFTLPCYVDQSHMKMNKPKIWSAHVPHARSRRAAAGLDARASTARPAYAVQAWREVPHRGDRIQARATVDLSGTTHRFARIARAKGQADGYPVALARGQADHARHGGAR